MFHMKWSRHSLVAASFLLGLSTAALAQTASPTNTSASERFEKPHGHPAHKHGHHLSDLKAKLKLTTSQELAWASYEQNMRSSKQDMMHSDDKRLEKLTTPERLDQMQNHRTQMNIRMEKNAEATRNFYAALDADQKIIFDAEALRALHGSHGRGHQQRH
jgi:L-lactate utilization protein LutC